MQSLRHRITSALRLTALLHFISHQTASGQLWNIHNVDVKQIKLNYLKAARFVREGSLHWNARFQRQTTSEIEQRTSSKCPLTNCMERFN